MRSAHGSDGAAVDLRPAGDPRLDREPAALALVVLLDLHRQRRARADQRHLAAQHVDEVRQLVERGPRSSAPTRVMRESPALIARPAPMCSAPSTIVRSFSTSNGAPPQPARRWR